MSEPCTFVGEFGVLVWPDSREVFLRSVEPTLEAARGVAREERDKGHEAVDICLFLERAHPLPVSASGYYKMAESAEEAEIRCMKKHISLEFEDGRTE